MNANNINENAISDSIVVIHGSESDRDAFSLRFFGFKPKDFIDDVINSVHDYVCDSLDEFQGAIVPYFPEDIVKEALDKFHSKLRASVDLNFDKFELYTLGNVFSISKDVERLLKIQEAPIETMLLQPVHDQSEEHKQEIERLVGNPIEEMSLDIEILDLRNKFRDVMIRQQKIETELESLKARDNMLNQMKSQLVDIELTNGNHVDTAELVQILKMSDMTREEVTFIASLMHKLDVDTSGIIFVNNSKVNLGGKLSGDVNTTDTGQHVQNLRALNKLLSAN